MRNSDIEGHLDRELFSAEEIAQRVQELAEQIDRDYEGKSLVLVGILKGAMMIMADLSRALKTDAIVDWMALSSYGNSTTSSGVVRILMDLDVDIAGRDVLVVEDVLDTGLTLKWVMRNLEKRNPNSLELLSLLRKPEARANNLNPKYVGFDIDDQFVIGYGMDFAEHYRNLVSIGVLRSES